MLQVILQFRFRFSTDFLQFPIWFNFWIGFCTASKIASANKWLFNLLRELIERKPDLVHETLHFNKMFPKKKISIYYLLFSIFLYIRSSADCVIFLFQFRRKYRVGLEVNCTLFALLPRCCWNVVLFKWSWFRETLTSAGWWKPHFVIYVKFLWLLCLQWLQT